MILISVVCIYKDCEQDGIPVHKNIYPLILFINIFLMRYPCFPEDSSVYIEPILRVDLLLNYR